MSDELFEVGNRVELTENMPISWVHSEGPILTLHRGSTGTIKIIDPRYSDIFIDRDSEWFWFTVYFDDIKEDVTMTDAYLRKIK